MVSGSRARAPWFDAPTQRLCSPEGYTIRLEEAAPDAFWIVTNPTHTAVLLEDVRAVTGTALLLADDRRLLGRLARYGVSQRMALLYSGFVIEQFYLKDTAQISFADAAARLCRVCIHYWQQREALGDSQAQRALPMLWRTYWQALDRVAMAPPDQRAMVEEAWQAVGFVQEHGRALDHWLWYLVDEAHAWFFADLLSPWLTSAQSGQEVREAEVAAVVWANQPWHTRIRPTTLAAPSGQRRIEALIEGWYLPRYDLTKARHLAAVLAADPSQPGILQGFLAIPRWMFTGTQRFYAAIIVAYAGTALQGDTWKTLYHLAETPLLWCSTVVVLAAGTYGYLAWGIERKTGVAARQRALALMLRGEGCALVVGALLTTIIAPIELDPSLDLTKSAFWSIPFWVLIVILYAQLALFFGIFVQLLFDDRPATAPLDAP